MRSLAFLLKYDGKATGVYRIFLYVPCFEEEEMRMTSYN